MKTIIFPTDFSLNSMHAIRYGLNLMKGEETRYILFNSYTDPSVGTTMTFDFEDILKSNSTTLLNKVLEELQDDKGYEGLEMELVNRFGDLPFALETIVKEYKADLVIMGASGSNGPNFSLFGSNSYASMKHLSCPVLAVPLHSPLILPKKYGLASEVELAGEEPYLDSLYELVNLHHSRIVGIHVGKKKLQLEYDRSYGDENLPYLHIDHEDPLVGIESAIGEFAIDLLVIIIPSKGFLEGLFHKSISKQIARKIPIPILALHA